jgi:hypothetical protein
MFTAGNSFLCPKTLWIDQKMAMLFWENKTNSTIHPQISCLSPLAAAEYYIMGSSTGYWSFFGMESIASIIYSCIQQK